MSDAPRRDPARAEPEDRPVAPVPDDEPGGDPDALGAWPEAQDEAEVAARDEAGTADGDAPVPQEEAPEQEQPAHTEDSRTREELLVALDEAEQQRDDYLDGMQRARAEFDNYRRRTMREGASQREAGKAEVTEGLLDVLDDLDRTLEAAEGSSDDGLAKGVHLVAEKLVAALRATGLERVDATGVPFDPNLHEAVQQRDADEPRDEPVVAQVLRPGYVLGGRVLRAAMVVVEQ